MEIKNRFNETTLCSFEVETIREAAEQGKANLYKANLRGADLRGANLRGADLRGADLRGADLYGVDLCGANLYEADLRGADLCRADLCGANLYKADLRGADLWGEKIEKTPLVVTGLTYWCLISDNYMRIGCKHFTHAEWANFNDEQIAAMGSRALEFWRQWKAPLLTMCAAHKPH